MSEEGGDASRGASGAGGAGAGGAGAAGAGAGRPLHARSFKLRFAANREQGRSYVSLVKPLALPATVTNKFYSREEPAALDEAGSRRALRRIEDMFALGPRDLYLAPATTSHQYGWWWREAFESESAVSRDDRRLHHHIRDSAWLKARLLVLAADDKLKQR